MTNVICVILWSHWICGLTVWDCSRLGFIHCSRLLCTTLLCWAANLLDSRNANELLNLEAEIEAPIWKAVLGFTRGCIRIWCHGDRGHTHCLIPKWNRWLLYQCFVWLPDIHGFLSVSVFILSFLLPHWRLKMIRSSKVSFVGTFPSGGLRRGLNRVLSNPANTWFIQRTSPSCCLRHWKQCNACMLVLFCFLFFKQYYSRSSSVLSMTEILKFCYH